MHRTINTTTTVPSITYYVHDGSYSWDILGCETSDTYSRDILGYETSHTYRSDILGCETSDTYRWDILGCETRYTYSRDILGCETSDTYRWDILGCEISFCINSSKPSLLCCINSGSRFPNILFPGSLKLASGNNFLIWNLKKSPLEYQKWKIFSLLHGFTLKPV